MNEPRDPMTPDPDEGPEEGGSGLPPELEKVLRGLTGGAPIDPRLVEMVQGMGLEDIDPQMVAVVAQQVQAMMSAPQDEGPVGVTLATDIARKAVAAEGDTLASPADRTAATEAVDVAGLWLDPVTDLTAADLRGTAWSAAEWVEATMPVWSRLVEPVAEGVSAAIGEAMGSQLGQLTELAEGGEVDLAALGIPEGLLPAGMDPTAMLGQLEPMMRRMSTSLFSLQLGQAVGTLAGDVLTGCEVSLPIVPTPTVALLPASVAAFAEGLEIDLAQVRLYLAVREVARARLFAAAPWVGPQLLAAVRDYARDITIDTDGIESALASVDPTDVEQVQEAVQDRLFHPQHSPAQRAALGRLETLLALVEGWVDVVTVEATRAAPAPGRGARRGRPAPTGQRRTGRTDLRGPRRPPAAPPAASRRSEPLLGAPGERWRRDAGCRLVPPGRRARARPTSTTRSATSSAAVAVTTSTPSSRRCSAGAAGLGGATDPPRAPTGPTGPTVRRDGGAPSRPRRRPRPPARGRAARPARLAGPDGGPGRRPRRLRGPSRGRAGRDGQGRAPGTPHRLVPRPVRRRPGGVAHPPPTRPDVVPVRGPSRAGRRRSPRRGDA